MLEESESTSFESNLILTQKQQCIERDTNSNDENLFVSLGKIPFKCNSEDILTLKEIHEETEQKVSCGTDLSKLDSPSKNEEVLKLSIDYYKSNEVSGTKLECDDGTPFLFVDQEDTKVNEGKYFKNASSLNCGSCSFITTSEKNLKNHQRKPAGNLLTCEVCDFKTEYAYNLKRHERKHTGDSFSCELCDYTTNYKQDLKNPV